jgi:hypothetical protein
MNEQGKKPFYKRTWVVLLAMAICFIYIGNYKTEDKKTSKSTSNESVSTQASNDIGQKMRKWVGETGNLHKATVGTWRNSTYSNRWHTASDWFIELTGASNPELQRKLDKLNIEQWLATVQEYSKQLEKCVSEITSDEKLWGSDSLVAKIASTCYIHMYMSD